MHPDDITPIRGTRTADVGTDILLPSGAFAYSRSRGLFVGVSLDGSVIGMDDSANRKIYGKEVTGEQILLGKRVESNPTVESFVNELQKSLLRTSMRRK